jgi:hypothetical protein
MDAAAPAALQRRLWQAAMVLVALAGIACMHWLQYFWISYGITAVAMALISVKLTRLDTRERSTAKNTAASVFGFAALLLYFFVVQGMKVGFGSATPYAFLAGATASFAVWLIARRRHTVSG